MDCMKTLQRIRKRHVVPLHLFILLSLLGGLTLFLLLPARASAHAILLKSDPTQNSVLATPPTTVRMWFSESLNPTYTTAYVVNAAQAAAQVKNNANTHVDNGDAHIAANDPKEMDLTLKSNLPSAVYSVVYRTQSADDGHILNGSFVFTVAAPNGTVPTYTGNGAALNTLGGANNTTGRLDGATLFAFLAIALVDIGVVFWVGAQLWRVFVLHLMVEEDEEQHTILLRMEQRFDRSFSAPLLVLIFLANIGILIGQAFSLVSGSWWQAFSPMLLYGLVAHSDFGLFWILRQVIVLLALAITLATMRMSRGREKPLNEGMAWLYFILSLGLLCAVTLSGHAAAARSNVIVLAVLSDLLHLLAASLWIGGMFYIALVYLPLLDRYPVLSRTRSLLAVLKHYSPLAFAGVALMAASGPLNATVRMDSWSELLATAYGRALVVKILLVCLLLLVSAYHVFLLRPRLAKTYLRYQTATKNQCNDARDDINATNEQVGDDARKYELIKTFTASQTKALEREVGQCSKRLSAVLRWEPVLGVMVLLCTGLLGVFSETLQSNVATPAPPPVVSKPYVAQVVTTDKQFAITMKIDPNTAGTNTFTATVRDRHGALVPTANIGVSLYLTMLDMDMGTQSINLQPDKNGNFSALDSLGMEGHWSLKINVQTTDNTLHSATIAFKTPTP
jgi:Putative copper export protein